MADYDATVALQAKGFQPDDYLAPIKAYALSQTGEGQALQNQQQQNTLGAYQKYATSHNPNDLAAAGPQAVQEGTLAGYTQANTGLVQANTGNVAQRTAQDRQNQLAQIGSGYLQNPTEDGRKAAITQAYNAGLFNDPVTGQHNDMLYHQFMTMPLDEFTARAKQFATAGVGPASEAPYKAFELPPGTSLVTGSGFQQAPGAAPLQPAQGRSAAVSSLGGTGGNANPLFASAESNYGLPPGYLARTNQIESRGNTNAYNQGSGAAGGFQFTPRTWSQYGAPGASPFDPVASTDAAARLAADNQRSLTADLGRAPSAAELYLAHQQGAGGAAALLANPSARAADLVGAKAIVANGGTPNMTAGQFVQMWQNKFNGAQAAPGGGNFALSGANPAGQGVSMPAVPAPSPYGSLGPAPIQPSALATEPASAPALAPPGRPTDTAPPPSGALTPSLASAQAPAAPPPPAAGAEPSTPPIAGRSASAAPTIGSASAPAPSAAFGLSTLRQGMTPFDYEKQQLDARRAVGEESTARDQFIAANNAQQGLMQLQDDLTKLAPAKDARGNPTFDMLAPGEGADRRIGLAKWINSQLAVIGAKPMFSPDQIAAAESANKTTGRLGFDLAGGLGKGEAGYIVNQAIGLNPSVMSTPQGAKLLIGTLMATQQRQKDFYLYQRQYADANNGNPIGAEVMFDQNSPPMTYVHDAQNLSRVPGPAVAYLQKHGNDPGIINAFNQQYGPGLARYFLGSRTQ